MLLFPVLLLLLFWLNFLPFISQRYSWSYHRTSFVDLFSFNSLAQADSCYMQPQEPHSWMPEKYLWTQGLGYRIEQCAKEESYSDSKDLKIQPLGKTPKAETMKGKMEMHIGLHQNYKIVLS